MKVIRPAIFDSSVLSAVSTRTGGVSPSPLGLNLSYSVGDLEANVTRNRGDFFGGLSIGIGELAVPRQIHGANVMRVHAPGVYDALDALFTDRRRLFLCVTVADCVPLLLYAPDIPAVAAVHAGWKGTVAGISGRAVSAMVRELSCNPSQIRAYIGPSASVCCYEVGEHVARQFDPKFVRRMDASRFVDLKAANRDQLLAAGIPQEQIEVSPSCTIGEQSLFHSFRRDGSRSGRMMGVIGLV